MPEPMGLLAIGAWVGSEPWEGWAATLAPPAIAPAVRVPERATPGGDALVEVATGRGVVSGYRVAKDALLLTPDTPSSRLAAGLKAVAEGASKALGLGLPGENLMSLTPEPMAPPYLEGAIGGLPTFGALPVSQSAT